MISGPVLFARFAFPPNALGYCGPGDVAELEELIAVGRPAEAELRRTARAFEGAWPYLELIGGCTGRDPLDAAVVEAYWIGNPLLAEIDLLTWGNSGDDRFRRRAGPDWTSVEAAINRGGVPNHAFHVFCAYPWVGLLRSGAVAQALRVLDKCRIRWGRVVAALGSTALVSSAPLEWDGKRLRLGPDRVEEVIAPVAEASSELTTGDRVALHWDYVCQRITARQEERLRRYHDLHLDIVNRNGRRLASRVEA